MDQDALDAATAAYHADTATAERWFEIMQEQHKILTDALEEGQEVTWNAFKTAFKTAAESEGYETETVDYFLVTHLEAVDADRRMAVVGQLADPDNQDEAVRAFTDAYPETADGAADESEDGYGDEYTDEAAEEGEYVEEPAAEVEHPAGDEPFDENAWTAFLHEQWALSDKSWPAFGARIADEASGRFDQAAATFRSYVDTADDKVVALAEYGLEGGQVAHAAAEQVAQVEELVTDAREKALESALADAATLAEMLEVSEEEARQIIREYGEAHLTDAVFAELGA